MHHPGLPKCRQQSFGARRCCTVGWWQWHLNEQNGAAIKKGSLSPLTMNYSTVLARLCHSGGEMSCWVWLCWPCRAGISGSLMASGQSCISLAAGRLVDSPVLCALEKALSQESVLQKFSSGWNWHTLICQLLSFAELSVLRYYPTYISWSLLFPIPLS